jgi:predicted DNA-binding transcriptional regulator YafY
MNRIDRISAILIQLQSRRVVKAGDIAARFKISLRTVYRDIRTLEEAGVPLIGEAGIGYSIMDGYRLPPVMFTKEEATAFLTAEKLMEKFTDPVSDGSYKSAMYKIRAVLKASDKDLLENMDGYIEVLKSSRMPDIRQDQHSLQLILNAIAQQKVLHMDYFSNHSREKTSRSVEPVGVFMSENNWHLVAWCRMRQDYRDFRLDRMSGPEMTGERYDKQHPRLKEFISKSADERKLHTVVIRVEKKILPYLEAQKYYYGFVAEQETDEYVELTFLTEWLEGFARWFMMFADMAEIITPDKVRDKVREIADAIKVGVQAG